MSEPQFQAPSIEELSELLPAYDITAFIAQGGMGAVYRAHQKSLERDVAIKILPRIFGADEDFRRRFESEAKAMARLNHPNLIGVYDFGEVDGMPYIVMEFVDGKSLFYSAHDKVIEQKEALRLVRGICEGLAHAHEADIIHRDIKPANILLDSKKRPKIGDFGLARALGAGEGDQMMYGTPGYSAPEVTSNPDSVDKRSDVYSTAVVLYELLTGTLPGSNYVPASQVQEVDPRFDKLIRRGMHPSPTLRFPDAGAMLKEVRALEDALSKPAASIVTAGGPMTPASPGQAPDSAAPPPVQVELSTGSNWALMRNLLVILALIAAIIGMYKAYEWKKEDNERRRVAQQEEANRQEQEALAQAENERRIAYRQEERREREERLPKPPEPPKPKTPLEVLGEMKRALANGDRTQFPPETATRGGNRFFFVEQPMTWSEAAAFAEEHGAHLATFPNKTEADWLATKIPNDTSVWIGGGAVGVDDWGWIDGQEWTLKKPRTSSGSVASLSSSGTLRAHRGGDQLPFFLQWQMDGENPGTLQAQLDRLKPTLSAPSPDWPPGSVPYENRRYLLVQRPMTWEDAAAFAKLASGHLAVPSEPTEGSYLLEAVSTHLKEDEAAWIGGRHNGRSWIWKSKEPFGFAQWMEGRPDGNPAIDSAIRIVAGPSGGWDDADPSDETLTAAFVIEWSEDSETEREATPEVAGDWANLRQKAKEHVVEKRKVQAEKLFKNGKDLKWDLDFWHRGLRDNEKRAYSRAVAQIKSFVQDDGRIVFPPGTNITLPNRGRNIVKNFVDREKGYDAEFESEVIKLRNAYLKKLQEKRLTLTEKGLTSQIRTIDNEIAACGDDPSTFLEHLTGQGLDRPDD